MKYENLIYEQEGHVVTLTYDRPHQHNAISREMNGELHHAWQRFRDDDEAFVLVITGAGEVAFCAGWDLQDAAELTEPGEPQQNGIHERMHRTLKQEATIPPASSMRAQQHKFDGFREEFNQVRPHEAIDMKRPGEIYKPSRRRMPRRIETYDYPSHYIVRRVSRAGTIRVFGKQFFVSNTLHEDYVGLEEVDDGVYDLFFCFYQIGRYDLSKNKIQDIVSKVPMTRAWADHPSNL